MFIGKTVCFTLLHGVEVEREKFELMHRCRYLKVYSIGKRTAAGGSHGVDDHLCPLRALLI